MKFPILILILTVAGVAAGGDYCKPPSYDKDGCLVTWCYTADEDKWEETDKDCTSKSRSSEECEMKYTWGRDSCWEWEECDGKPVASKTRVADRYCESSSSSDSYLSSDLIHKCSNKDSEDSCE